PGTPLRTLFKNLQLASAPAFRLSPQTSTKVFLPAVTPLASRLPRKLVHHENLYTLLVKSSKKRLKPLLSSSPPPVLSVDSIQSISALERCIKDPISTEREVDFLMANLLRAAADLAHDVAGSKTEFVFERSSTLGIFPKVIQELVGNLDGSPRLSVEVKAPAVGQKHFAVLVSEAQKPGGWAIPQGAVSIISKLSYYLTDDEDPHRYAILYDGRYLHILVKRNAHYPTFFISPAITLTDPFLFHVLIHLFLWDPPSSLEHGYDAAEDPPPDSAEASPPTTVSSPPPDDEDSSAGITTVLQRCKDRLPKSSVLKITHCTETIPALVVSSFDDAPSRATVMHGMLGSNQIVIKLAAQDRDNDTKAEGVIYRNRLRGIEGVPKFYAEGWLYSNEHWVYCLVLEDLGIPLTQEGIQSTDEIDAVSLRQLEDLQAGLLERGVIHDDVEPRNIIRTRSGGIGLVDFEGAWLVPL
ncbi:hypothetical protein B0H16DRAFT_1536775, partial [Mycena metata]